MKKQNIYTVRLIRADDINAYHRLIKNNRTHLDGFFTETLSLIQTPEDTFIYLAYSIR